MNWYKYSETVKIRDFYTLRPKAVYVARNPSWDQILKMLDKGSFSSVRLIRHNGEVFVWDSSDALHSQIASVFGIPTKDLTLGPELEMDQKYNIILSNPPGPLSFSINDFFGKKLIPYGSNKYLVKDK